MMDLTTVDELLTTTRSFRKRLDLTRPVQPAVIQQCLEIAVQAPTGGDTARYHFMVVTDRVKRAGLYSRDAAALLGIPDEITQAALLPVAYLVGTELHRAKRVPAQDRTYWDFWGQLG